MVRDSLEVLSGVFRMNGVRSSGLGCLLPKRIYEYFSVFRRLPILLIPTSQVFNLLPPIILPRRRIEKPEMKAGDIPGT
jgi:hypothetical protein